MLPAEASLLEVLLELVALEAAASSLALAGNDHPVLPAAPLCPAASLWRYRSRS